MKLLDSIDNILNELTMYRLLVYGLSLLVGIVFAFSIFGTISPSPLSLAVSLSVLFATCYFTNLVLGKIWQAVPNLESSLITSLILFFILTPATTTSKVAAIGVAGFVAIASKYLIAYNNKHIFNPAAFGAVVVGLIGIMHPTWWIGSSTLWPYTLVLGLLVVRKIRRFSLLLSFIVVSLATSIIMAIVHGQPVSLLQSTLLASPLIFLGTIMLTEPATMPSRKRGQIIFGALVGLLYSLHLQLPGVYIYPETALIIANVYAYLVSPKMKVNLVLKEVHKISDRVFNYVFTSEQILDFKPGQYMEWTLPNVAFDGRGNRRTFTIASSPTENEVMLGVKFYEPSSSYKRTLRVLKPGERIAVGEIAGDFSLPADTSQKLVFIGGGIGITPFRSMLKYILDTNQKRDVILFYIVSSSNEFAYRDLIQQSVNNGVRVIPIVSSINTPDWKGHTGSLTKELLTKYAPDLIERKIYISGPNAMVNATKHALTEMKIRRSNIVTDYFSGY